MPLAGPDVQSVVEWVNAGDYIGLDSCCRICILLHLEEKKPDVVHVDLVL